MIDRILPRALSVLLIGVCTSPLAAVERVERLDIVDRAIEHHGGDLYGRSVTRLEVCSKSGCFEVHARVDGGVFDYTVAGRAGPGLRKVRWRNDSLDLWLDGSPAKVPADRLQAMRDWAMARVYFAFLPYRLNDPGVYKQDQGLETWGGRQLRRVKVTFEPGSSTDADDEYLYWFDPETGRLEQFAYSYSGEPGGLRFRRLSNFRRVGGLLFFDQLNLGQEGDGLTVDSLGPDTVDSLRQISTVRLENIEVRPLD